MAWFSCLGLWNVGNKWPFFFLVWQIFSKSQKSKNTWRILTQKQLDCLPVCCMFWLTQHVCSITSQIRLEHSKSTWRLDNIFVCFILIKTNNNIRQLSPLWQPWRNLAKMCRFFAFSRIFLLIYEAWYFFAQNSISVTWKHYPMREFDWMVTLTVAFFDGVSRRLSVFMRS